MSKKPTIYWEVVRFTFWLLTVAIGVSIPTFSRDLAASPIDLEEEPGFSAAALPGAPSVQLLAPANGTNIPLGTSLLLSARASDSDGIDFVDFLRNGERIGRAARSVSDG